MLSNKKLLIVMGAPRSGTTWIQAMVAAHPDVCTAEELFIFTEYVSKWVHSWEQNHATLKHGANVGLSAVWNKEELDQFLREFLDRVYARVLARKPGATIILDKQPAYVNQVELINHLVPDVHFIHIIRDGRDMVSSMLAASKGWGHFWASDDVFATARRWSKDVQKGREAQRYAKRYTEVRYEDLLADGVSHLMRIFQEIGLDVDREMAVEIVEKHSIEGMRKHYTIKADEPAGKRDGLDSTFAVADGFFRKGKAGSWREDLSVRQRYQIQLAAGTLLHDLGYVSDDGWWYAHPFQKVWVPSVVRFLMLMKRVLGRLRRLF